MYESGYVFSKKFFTGWIAFTFVRGFFGAITITGLPLWESRREIQLFFSSIVDDVRGRRKGKETLEVDGSIERSNEKFVTKGTTDPSDKVL